MGRWRPAGLTEGRLARQTSKRTVRIARQLRKEMSLPEVLLWQRLRHADLKIRKQHPCGPYVLDFYCPAAKLAIEIDGIAHDMGDRPRRDEARDAFVRERGVDVIRLAAAEVLRDVDAAANSIVAACRGRCA
jgi:very-short-patch-repair endonuclease